MRKVLPTILLGFVMMTTKGGPTGLTFDTFDDCKASAGYSAKLGKSDLDDWVYTETMLCIADQAEIRKLRAMGEL